MFTSERRMKSSESGKIRNGFSLRKALTPAENAERERMKADDWNLDIGFLSSTEGQSGLETKTESDRAV